MNSGIWPRILPWFLKSAAYQVCDDKTCYLPKAIPIRWVIQILNLDEERVPEMIRNHP
jgi:hypothetical protein